MTDAVQIQFTNTQEAEEAARFAAKHGPKMGAQPPMGAKINQGSRQEVIYHGGENTAGSQTRTPEAVTYQIPTQTRPGFINVPGMGETPVAAAKAAGLLPPNWQEGDPNPFAGPADVPHSKQATGTDAGTDQKQEAGNKDGPEGLAAERAAKAAGEVLDAADNALGAEATDALLNKAAELGELPDDMLPEGFTRAQVAQVHAGYVAQANAALASVGASVGLLEDTLTDAELLQARKATLANSRDELTALGQLAVSRLAQLDRTNPEGFAQMVDDMTPAERKCINYDRHRSEWVVSIPGAGTMSYGAAVHAGFIRV